jgi:hypothetical protein
MQFASFAVWHQSPVLSTPSEDTSLHSGQARLRKLVAANDRNTVIHPLPLLQIRRQMSVPPLRTVTHPVMLPSSRLSATSEEASSSVRSRKVGAKKRSPCFHSAHSTRLSAIAEEASSSGDEYSVASQDGSQFAEEERSSGDESAVAAEDGSQCFDHWQRPVFEGEPDPSGATYLRWGLKAQGFDATRRS